METAEMFFLRVIVGHRMMDHEHNENIRDQLSITAINTVIKTDEINA
jgi:hypothetical protein